MQFRKSNNELINFHPISILCCHVSQYSTVYRSFDCTTSKSNAAMDKTLFSMLAVLLSLLTILPIYEPALVLL